MGEIHLHNLQRSPKKLGKWRKKGKWGNKGKKKRKLAGQIRKSNICRRKPEREKQRKWREENYQRNNSQVELSVWCLHLGERKHVKTVAKAELWALCHPSPTGNSLQPSVVSSDVLRQDGQAQDGEGRGAHALLPCFLRDHLLNSGKSCRWAGWTATLLLRESSAESQLQEKAGLG